MTEPKRLRIDGASDFERELLSSWRARGPSSAARARTRALMSTGLGAAVTVAATASTASAAASATGSAYAPKLAVVVAKWLGVGVVTGLATSAATLTLADPPAPPATERPSAAAVAAARESSPAKHSNLFAEAPPEKEVPRVTPPSEAPAPSRAALEPVIPKTAPASIDSNEPVRTTVTPSGPAGVLPVAPAARAGSLGPETQMLDRARAALRAGAATTALEHVAEYERAFARGVLSQEAEILRIEALEARGDRRAAADRARRFLESNPNSPHAARLGHLTSSVENP